MFTGIVETRGTVVAVALRDGGARLRIDAPAVVTDATPGASIAVNGCCLTMVAFDATGFEIDAMPETLARTTIGSLGVGDHVNLERPVRLEDRLGGHLVQGHIDGIGTVTEWTDLPDGSARVTFATGPVILRYVVEKGSIAVDGVSLTVAACDADTFTIALIPHTLAETTLGTSLVGTRVNLEADVLAKYAERLLTFREVAS